MGHNKKLNFIVIDDSKLDCFIAEKVIEKIGKSESIISFVQAREALDYIIASSMNQQSHTMILVDIQMPVMNGFEFVEAFEQLPKELTDHYSIFVISSSINDYDLKRVNDYPSVKHFLNKPLNGNNLSELLLQL